VWDVGVELHQDGMEKLKDHSNNQVITNGKEKKSSTNAKIKEKFGGEAS